MPYAVYWAPTAKKSYVQILKHIQERWTEKELIVFINRTEEVISHMSNNPLLYPYSQQHDVHKCVIMPQVSLFYRRKLDVVQLLLFWDNRRNPKKLNIKP